VSRQRESRGQGIKTKSLARVLNKADKSKGTDKVPRKHNQQLPGLATTARAFATYSLVPYLGILFCPGAVVVGTLGVFRSYSSPNMAAARTACYLSTAAGVTVLIVQLLLWWILYQVPAWALHQ
jgi:hypothetical protein